MNYKNLPSQKFFEFFSKKINNKEITREDLAVKLEKYENNPSVLLNGIKYGKNSVTVEMILKAQEHFGLDPCDLFHEQRELTLNEPQALYGKVDQLINVIAQQQQTINKLIGAGGNELRKNA